VFFYLKNKMIDFTPSSIQSVIAKIKDVHSNLSGEILNKAISRGLNHTSNKTKTFANEQIRKRYNISASKVRDDFKTLNSNQRNLTAELVAKGAPISLNYFGAKQEGKTATTSFNRKGVASSRLNRKSRSNVIKGVSFEIKKGENTNLPTAFIQVANGGITVFARGKAKGKGRGFQFGKDRMPIGKIDTTSIPLMFINNDVMQPSMKFATSILEDRIEHEIKYLLSKM
jgi:Prophage minor tail protein Z (GPZ)